MRWSFTDWYEDERDPAGPMQCGHCGGIIHLARGRDRRFRFFDFTDLPLPDHVLLPTCDHCGDNVLGPDEFCLLDIVLRAEAVHRGGLQALRWRRQVG